MLVVETRGLKPFIARLGLRGEMLSTGPFSLAALSGKTQAAAITVTHPVTRFLPQTVSTLRRLNVPIIPLHHLETYFSFHAKYPYLALIATHSETQLALIRGLGDYHLISITLDASLGKAVTSLASEFSSKPDAIEQLAVQGGTDRIHIPVPLSTSPAVDFSFQGPWMRALQHLYPRS